MRNDGEYYPPVTEDENGAVERLVRLAEELGVIYWSLDPYVYDMANDIAADRVNANDFPENEEYWAAYNRLHNEADEIAADVNNGGIEAQLTYLLRGNSEKSLEGILRNIANRAAAGAAE